MKMMKHFSIKERNLYYIMERIIAVANQKGGVGKTTTAINLSACLAEAGKKVLTVDMDPQGNTTSGLGIDKNEIENTVYELILDECEIEDCLLDTEFENLSLISSNMNLAGAEIELLNIENKEYRLKMEIKKIKDNYDYIIIDCPPLGLVIDAAIIGHQSDGAIIVVEAGKTKYRLVQNVKDQLENSGVSVLGVVLNKVERKNQKGYYNKYYGSQKYEGYYGHNEETKNA